MSNQNNNCGCNCNPNPAPDQPFDINMQVCDRNIDALSALQTYTTKVLKPNTESIYRCHKNILIQQMLGCENCKYVIRWDFDLNGETIELPPGCILSFEEGSLKNGTVVLNGCAVYPSFDSLVNDALTIEGMPKAGTTKWDGKPLWSDGEQWVDASGTPVDE